MAKLTKQQRRTRATLSAHIKNLTLEDCHQLQIELEQGHVSNALKGLIDRIEQVKRADRATQKQTDMFADTSDDMTVITRPPFQEYFA